MQIKSILLFLLFFVIFYAILSYLGYTRYINLHLNYPKNYIPNFRNLDKVCQEKVIVSLTTNKPFHTLRPTINSILDQSTRVDLIALTVPYKNKEELPKDLQDCVMLYKTGKDYYDANSIIPCILREGESTTKIITIGDNTIYGKDFVEKLLRTSEKYPNKVIFVQNDNNTIDINKGALFKTSFFDNSFIDIPDNYNENFWVNKHVREKYGIKYNKNYDI